MENKTNLITEEQLQDALRGHVSKLKASHKTRRANGDSLLRHRLFLNKNLFWYRLSLFKGELTENYHLMRTFSDHL